MKKFITLKTSFIVVYALLILGLFAAPLHAQSYIIASTPAEDSCAALQLGDSSVSCGSKKSVGDVPQVHSLVTTVLNTLSIVVGAVSVIMIIIGGFRYVISGGDSSATKSAKDTILYAVIGLAVVIFAQIIVRFVITQTTGK